MQTEALAAIFNEQLFDFNADSYSTEVASEHVAEVKEAPANYATQKEAPPVTASNFKFAIEGDPSKGIALFFPQDSSSSASDKEFLKKILSAVNTQIPDTFVSVSSNKNVYEEASKRVKIKKAIFWGISPFELGIKDQKFDLYKLGMYNKSFVLHVDTLSDIAASQDKKAALWEALKRMFF